MLKHIAISLISLVSINAIAMQSGSQLPAHLAKDLDPKPTGHYICRAFTPEEEAALKKRND